MVGAAKVASEMPLHGLTCILHVYDSSRRRRDATIAKSLCDHSKCPELTLEQHDFDEFPTLQPAGWLNVGYFQIKMRPLVL